jgi:putative transposase
MEVAAGSRQAFYRLPVSITKHLKSTNLLERLNEEIKRGSHVVAIFPDAESSLRLIRALTVECPRTGWKRTAA